MNFGFTEEQELLRGEARKFLDQHAPIANVRKWVETPEGFSRELWAQMAELGWTGLLVPEEHGGVGLDLVTLLVVLEETGRTLCPSPLISNSLAARAIALCGSSLQQARWLPELAQGTKIGTLAHLEVGDGLGVDHVRLEARETDGGLRLDGAKCAVADAPAADLFVVSYRAPGGAIGLGLVERGAAGVEVESFEALDPSKSIGALRLDGVVLGSDAVLASADAGETLEALLEIGAALVTAEGVGAAEGALAITVQFANEREQFGKPIGTYQGVKHPLAEMFVDIESIKSLAYYAAWALDEGADDASVAVSRAKAYASCALPKLGIDCVQLHGGVGYTWEYDIQLYLKRTKWLRPSFGDADYHYERLAALGDA
jgi:alkylation response protein AidB-like acyl-CoA dehydrogenase